MEKRLHLQNTHWIFILFLLGSTLPAVGQLQISYPTNRMVLQRGLDNTCNFLIAGTYNQFLDRVEARLVPKLPGQGEQTDWMLIQINPRGGVFSGQITGKGGWYSLEVRGLLHGETVGNPTNLDRMGIGEVFLIMGHSNASGGEVYSPSRAAADDRVTSINMNNNPAKAPYISTADVHYLQGLEFSQLCQNCGMAPFTGVPWLWSQLGDMLVQKLNVPVLFYNSGFGGTNMEQNYKAAAGIEFTHGLYNPKTGLPYANTKNTLNRWVPSTGLRAVLLLHGENDRFDERGNPFLATSDNLAAYYKYVIEQSRRDALNPNLVWMVANSSYVGEPAPNVIEGQNKAIASTPLVYRGPFLDQVQGLENRIDGIHYTSSGQTKVAQLWNEALSASFFQSASPQLPVTPPVITATCVSSGNTVALSLSANFVEYEWSNGERTPNIVATGGTYSVKVRDARNNWFFIPSVTVTPILKPVVVANGLTTLCQNQNLELSSSVPGRYQWSNGSTSPTITVTSSGKYSVKVTTPNGCVSVSSDEISVQVNPVPEKPRLAADGPTIFCPGGTVALRPTNGPFDRYQWNNGSTNAAVTVGQPGSYQLRVTNNFNCSVESDPVGVQHHPTPAKPSVQARGNTVFCDGGNVELSASESTTYQWSNGQKDRNIRATAAGEYRVKTVNQFGCASSESDPVRVTVNPLPIPPNLSATGPTFFCEGGKVSLCASSPWTINWSNGVKTACFEVKNSGNFTATVTDRNGCTSWTAPALQVLVQPIPPKPAIEQVGTFTLLATATNTTGVYDWKVDADTVRNQKDLFKTSKSGQYSARTYVEFTTPTALRCYSEFSLPYLVQLVEGADNFSVYPNPTRTGSVLIDSRESWKNMEIQVYSMDGKQLFQQVVTPFNERFKLDLGLIPGKYIIHLRSDGLRRSKPVIVTGQ
ncbi:MAG: T9SS type A sorting domain-containing protein [Cytophagaceae bacterium]|nr:T9SS type A sorting domain-containing protein [Cytophagaceae bacterium]